MKLKSVKLRDAITVKGVKALGGMMAGSLTYFTSEMCDIRVEAPFVVLRSNLEGEYPQRHTPLSNVIECEPESQAIESTKPADQNQKARR